MVQSPGCQCCVQEETGVNVRRQVRCSGPVPAVRLLTCRQPSCGLPAHLSSVLSEAPSGFNAEERGQQNLVSIKTMYIVSNLLDSGR